MIAENLLKMHLSIHKLNDLSAQMPAVAQALVSIAALASNNVLDQSITTALIAEYKASVKAVVIAETTKAIKEANFLSKASTAEVKKEMGDLTPIISGTPILTSTTPSALTADANLILADIPNLIQTLNTINNSFTILN